VEEREDSFVYFMSNSFEKKYIAERFAIIDICNRKKRKK